MRRNDLLRLMELQLLAWAFGDLEYVEELTQRKYDGKQLPVRVYTTRGLKEQGRFGLQNAHQMVDYFSEVSRPAFLRQLLMLKFGNFIDFWH